MTRSDTTAGSRPSISQRALARDQLGTGDIWFFAMSAVAPLTVFAGVIVAGFAVAGFVGIPFAFVALAAVLGLFCVGYVAMAHRVPKTAGALYAYIRHGLGPAAGLAAGLVAVLAYTFLADGLYGVIGAATAPLLDKFAHVQPRWWVVALTCWAIVAVLGLLNVKVSSRVAGILLLGEVVYVLVVNAANLGHPNQANGDPGEQGPLQATLSTLTTALNPTHLFAAGFGAAAVIAVTGFVGIETPAVFADRAKPGAVVKATYLSLGIVTALYVTASLGLTVAVGPDNVVAEAQADPAGLVFALAGKFLGGVAADLGGLLFATSVFAAMISFHQIGARYLYALGHEGVLPAVFGKLSRRHGAPWAGSLTQTAAGLAVILIYIAGGWDPLLKLFFLLGTAGGFGVLVLWATTSVAVVAYFAKLRRGRVGYTASAAVPETAWQRVVAPTVAAVCLAALVVLGVANFHLLAGVAPDAIERWVLPGAVLAAAVLGMVWALLLRRFKFEVYDSIGTGAAAVHGASLPARTSGPMPAPSILPRGAEGGIR